MNNIYNLSFQIYRLMIFISLPVFFIGKLLVGFSGHNPPRKNSDYIIFSFVVSVIATLIFFKKIDKNNVYLKNLLRITLIVLALIGIAMTFPALYDFWLLYQKQNFGLSDNIPVAIIICFDFISAILITGLVKDSI